MKIILPIATLLVAAGLFLLLYLSRPAPELREPEEVVIPVEYLSVEKQSVTLTVTTQGILEPVLQSTLASEVAGRILHTSDKFMGGFFVSEGEVLMELDPTDYEVALSEADASLLSARTRLEEARADAEQALLDLKDVGVNEPTALALREPQLLQAKAAVESAEANLRLARRNLERTKIKVPYDAQIRNILVQKGDVLTGLGSPIAEVYGTQWGEVRLPLSRSDSERLNLPGTPEQINAPSEEKPIVRFYLTQQTGDPYRQGWIDRLEGTVDPVSRLRYAVARLEYPLFPKNPSEPSLPFGSFLVAKIEGVELANSFLLPEAALLGRDRMRIIDDENTLREISVQVAQRQNGMVVITSGIEDGTRVCLTPVYPFTPGMRVEPIQARFE